MINSWPTRRTSGLVSPLASINSCTVTPNSSAIVTSVSPGWTTYFWPGTVPVTLVGLGVGATVGETLGAAAVAADCGDGEATGLSRRAGLGDAVIRTAVVAVGVESPPLPGRVQPAIGVSVTASPRV